MKINNFNFSVYRLNLECKERIELPRLNKGITLRGAFGTVFRRLVCHDLKAQCPACHLKENCPYCSVFSPVVPPEAKRLRLNRDIPRPFVIKPPLNGKDIYTPGDILGFDLVVVGNARDFLPYFIVTFEELGRQGIGIGRGKYMFKSLEAMKSDRSWHEIYDYRERMVRPPNSTLALDQFTLEKDESIQDLKIEFLTPVLLKEKGQWVRPEFGPLVKRLRDRLNALSCFYCGHPLEMDFKELGEQAENVRTVKDNFKWVEESRYSGHRGIKHLLKGFLGEILFEGDIGPFMPLLRLGEFVHVGKATAFGQGWFRIGGQRAEDRGQRSEDSGQRTEGSDMPIDP